MLTNWKTINSKHKNKNKTLINKEQQTTKLLYIQRENINIWLSQNSIKIMNDF